MIEVRTPAAPVEVVTPIKPSEALRLGRLVRPLHVNAFWFDGEASACALGAMHVGWGGDVNEYGLPEPATVARLMALGIADPDDILGNIFDDAERFGADGDAAVLAYLAERGL